MPRKYVLLQHRDGKTSIAKDYGDYAWGGPALQVIGYFDTRKDAQRAAAELRQAA